MNLAICLPGYQYTGNFLVSFTKIIRYCFENNINFFVNQLNAANIYTLREIMTESVLNKYPEYDYMLWIDSDQVFDENDLKMLLDLNVDIASGYYKTLTNFLSCGYFEDKIKLIKEINSEEKSFEVDFVGFGFILIKKGVIEKMDKPIFSMNYNTNLKEYEGEDINFCRNAKDKGFKIVVHSKCRVGHEKNLII